MCFIFISALIYVVRSHVWGLLNGGYFENRTQTAALKAAAAKNNVICITAGSLRLLLVSSVFIK